jgi:hypothetical protein
MDLLEGLGSYEFNFSRGNEYELRSPEWASRAETLALVADLPQGTGDIYARLTR